MHARTVSLPTDSVDGVDLRLAALIAPDQSGTDDPIAAIEQHESVHLARETDSANVSAGLPGGSKHAAYSVLRGIPPVFRTLLRPQRTAPSACLRAAP